ncbi:DBH-like monooxygenase protein 1 [Nematostella vectensis]|uniref:DBH-like monooxygenase protein 1 n=1 Tax=Nematostella vectensis TaxID=45351 RepID=UPI00138FCCAA|nr:DBH-like monooxygenase protein 1 [Nematostella vectensis]
MSAVQTFLSLFGALAAVFPITSAMSYPHKLDMHDRFSVHWFYNATESKFYFKVVANTTGWAGFAMTTNYQSPDMINYDIALGGMRGNTSYLNDYWSPKIQKPELDTKQDLTLISAAESGGITTLEFSRLADTGDTDHDVQIKNNTAIYMAWAVGQEDATDSTTFLKHADKAGGGRGHWKVAYNMMTGQVIPETTTAPTIKAAAADMRAPAILMAVTAVLQMVWVALAH